MLGTLLRLALWLVAGLVVLMGATMLVFLVPHSLFWRSREETFVGPDPTRRALIVYQPGLSAQPRTVALSLAQGLNDAGYTVTVDRPGRHLPTDLTPFGVVAFGSPVYAGQTSPALRRYMASVRTWGDQAIILFTVGADPHNDDADRLASLVPAERVVRRVKFLFPADNRADARSLGKAVGTGDGGH
jgi:drug/metabolite transporter (DMT)-like permease